MYHERTHKGIQNFPSWRNPYTTLPRTTSIGWSSSMSDAKGHENLLAHLWFLESKTFQQSWILAYVQS